MKRIGLLLTIIASVAGCEAGVQTQPVYVRNDPQPAPPPPQPDYRPDPRPDPRPAPIESRWTPLAEGYSAQTERQFIKLQGDSFRRIRVEPTRGNPVFKMIGIEFADQNRETQVVKIDSHLPSGQVIDLNGGRRSITRIIVYTDAGHGGSYSVFGT
jgi:hypothetical protein